VIGVVGSEGVDTSALATGLCPVCATPVQPSRGVTVQVGAAPGASSWQRKGRECADTVHHGDEFANACTPVKTWRLAEWSI